MRAFPFFVAVLLTASAAAADSTAAEQCAAGLGKDPRAIYDACSGSVQPSTNLKELLTEKTRGLVLAGAVTRGTARDSAREASACLEMKQKGQ